MRERLKSVGLNLNTAIITVGIALGGYLAKENHEDARRMNDAMIHVSDQVNVLATNSLPTHVFEFEMLKVNSRLSATESRQSAQDIRMAGFDLEIMKLKEKADRLADLPGNRPMSSPKGP